MTNTNRPALPDTTGARIALARAIIEQVIAHEDATLTGEHAGNIGCQCFTVQAGSFELGIKLNKAIADAIIAAGFGSCTFGSPVGGPRQAHVGLYYHVPVQV